MASGYAHEAARVHHADWRRGGCLAARCARAATGPQLGGKWLEILKEIAPRVIRVQILLDSQYVGYVALSQAIETVASRLGVVPIVARIHDSAEIKDAIQRFAQEPNGGLVVLPSPVTAVERELIVGLAAKHRLPAVYPYRFFTVSGGLVAYGVDPPDFYRRAASYVDLILKGAKPWDLPVQYPTKFEFVINRKTANELGLVVPWALLIAATELID